MRHPFLLAGVFTAFCTLPAAHAETLTPSNDRATVTWQSATGLVICDLKAGGAIAERSATGILSQDGRYALTQNAPERGLTLRLIGQPEVSATLLPDAPLWQDSQPFAYLGFFATFSNDGQWVAINHGGDIVSVWDTTLSVWDAPLTGQMRWKKRLLGASAAAFQTPLMMFTPDNERLLWVGDTGKAGVIDIVNGQEVLSFQIDPDDVAHFSHIPTGLDISPDGQQLAVAGNSGRAYVYDLHTGKRTESIGITGRYLNDVHFALDGRALLLHFTNLEGQPSRVALVEIGSGKVLLDLPQQERNYSAMGLSADGQTLALQEAHPNNERIQLYDVVSGQLVLTAPKCTDW